LLEQMPRLGQPVLRFYSWTEPAASFGYFQKYSDVEAWTLLRPLVRRPTGGGLVPHEADWTYSVVFPVNHEWYSLAAIESYLRVHQWLQAAFASLKVETELADVAHKSQPGQCFAGYERFDLLWCGRKVAGAAQRRRREGLLIQGSIQPPPLALDRSAFEEAFCAADALAGPLQWEELELGTQLKGRVAALEREKYSQVAYNQRR